MKKILVALLIFVFIVSCQPSTAKIQEAIQQTQSAIPTPTITNTPAPTYTPKPTKTPKPTVTATPIPQPIKFEGSGDSVIEYLVNWGGPSLLEITNNGSSNFVVKNYGESAEYIDLLVNAIGQYHGKLLIDIYDDEKTQRLEIKSSGLWSVTAYPFSLEYFDIYNIPGKYEGIGDSVLVLTGDPDIGTFTNEERTNFIVWGSSESGRDLLINEIGPYSGVLMLPKETIILEILTEGNWTIEITGK